MVTTGKRCKAKNERGGPCGAFALKSSDYCFYHDPTNAKERAAARAKGGRARHGRTIGKTGSPAPVELQTMADVVALLEETVNDTLALENSLQRARTIATLANVVIKALEFATLAERVEALERALKERGRVTT